VFNFIKFSKKKTAAQLANEVFEKIKARIEQNNKHKTEDAIKQIEFWKKNYKALRNHKIDEIADEFSKKANEIKKAIPDNQNFDIDFVYDLLLSSEKEIDAKLESNIKDTEKIGPLINEIKKTKNYLISISGVNASEDILQYQNYWWKNIKEILKPLPDTLKNEELLELKEFIENLPKINRFTIYERLGIDFEYTGKFWQDKDLNDEYTKNLLGNQINSFLQNGPEEFLKYLAEAVTNKQTSNNAQQLHLIYKHHFNENQNAFYEYIFNVFPQIKNYLPNQSGEESTFENFIKLINDKKSELDVLLDAQYDGAVRFSSKEEKDCINFMRNDCQLKICPSEIEILAPGNLKLIDNISFKSDFVLYCPVFKNNEVKNETLVVGEYFGYYRFFDLEKINKLKQEISNLEKQQDEQSKIMLKSKKATFDLGAGYFLKTEQKIPSESFNFGNLNAGVVSILPEEKFPKNVISALDEANVIYMHNNKKSKAWREADAINQKITKDAVNEVQALNNNQIYLKSIELKIRQHYLNECYASPNVKNIYKIKTIEEDSKNKFTFGNPQEIQKAIFEYFYKRPPVQIELENFQSRLISKIDEKAGQRMTILNELMSMSENLNFVDLKRYVEENLLNFKKIIMDPMPSNPKVARALNNKNIQMDKIKKLKNLIRLSKIAEAIEEDHPDAANLIDESVEERSNDPDDMSIKNQSENLPEMDSNITITDDEMPDDEPKIENKEFNPTNYPPVKTPFTEEPKVSDDELVRQISDDVFELVKDKDYTQEEIRKIIDEKVRKALE